MPGGGHPAKGNNWLPILQAVSIAFTMFVVILGGFMAYAYVNGGTAQRLNDHERRIDENSRRLGVLENRLGGRGP